MDNKGILTKVLAVAGTIFVWLPILVPILFSAVRFAQARVFNFDYLIPAELGLFAFGGGILLLVAAIRAHSHVKFIGWGLGIALITVVGGQALVVVTGLADGTSEPVGWPWMIVLASLALYGLALVVIGVGGALVVRDVFKPSRITTTAQ